MLEHGFMLPLENLIFQKENIEDAQRPSCNHLAIIFLSTLYRTKYSTCEKGHKGDNGQIRNFVIGVLQVLLHTVLEIKNKEGVNR